jgi:release factor glutamine methyltransferase
LPEQKTILEVLQSGAEALLKKGVDSPRLSMELILAHILGLSRVQLYTSYDKPLKENELAPVREAFLRRASHEPVQYILGKAEFMGYELKVTQDVLIPRPETEILVSTAFDRLYGKSPGKILEIGTGSACISIALAKNFPSSEITAIDISENALKIARENADMHNCRNIKFRQSDIRKEYRQFTDFDVIISNPPYISNKEFELLETGVKEFEPSLALKDEGNGLRYYIFFEKIFNKILTNGGYFFLEFGYRQDEYLKPLFSKSYSEIIITRDLSGLNRVLSGVKAI